MANVYLAAMLAFTAGLVDVSGYLGLRQFTSHMTGTVAAMAAGLGEREESVVLRCAMVVGSFLLGAAMCAVVVNFSRRRDRESLYALPVFLESVILAAIGCTGPGRTAALDWLLLSGLGFAMGLQNAIITKISDAHIRTTHITGTMTDIGIELGRALYLNRDPAQPPVQVRRERLALLVLLAGCFTSGAVLASFTFPRAGFHVFLPLAAILAAPTVLPIAADLKAARPRTI